MAEALSTSVEVRIREELRKCRFFSSSFGEGSGYESSFLCTHAYVIDNLWNRVPYFLKLGKATDGNAFAQQLTVYASFKISLTVLSSNFLSAARLGQMPDTSV
eukprot:gene4147-14245_t